MESADQEGIILVIFHQICQICGAVLQFQVCVGVTGQVDDWLAGKCLENFNGFCHSSPTEITAVAKKLEEAGYKIDTMELTYVASNTVACDEKAAATVMRICGVLEDDDDVQNVYTNADISDEIMEKLD